MSNQQKGLQLAKAAQVIPLSGSTYRLVETKFYRRVLGTSFGADLLVGLTIGQSLSRSVAELKKGPTVEPFPAGAHHVRILMVMAPPPFGGSHPVGAGSHQPSVAPAGHPPEDLTLPRQVGAYAAQLLQRQSRRLGKLQAVVLADRDPEDLHQLRVSLRRLRTALGQFAPALELPAGVSERRIAKVARRTGLCRDLDVLRERLETGFLPKVPDQERKALKQVIKFPFRGWNDQLRHCSPDHSLSRGRSDQWFVLTTSGIRQQ